MTEFDPYLHRICNVCEALHAAYVYDWKRLTGIYANLAPEDERCKELETWLRQRLARWSEGPNTGAFDTAMKSLVVATLAEIDAWRAVQTAPQLADLVTVEIEAVPTGRTEYVKPLEFERLEPQPPLTAEQKSQVAAAFKDYTWPKPVTMIGTVGEIDPATIKAWQDALKGPPVIECTCEAILESLGSYFGVVPGEHHPDCPRWTGRLP